MRICYIDDNEEYLNSFKDNFKDVFCENDFTFMQYPNEYIGSDEVADIVMLDIEFGSEERVIITPSQKCRCFRRVC